MAAFHTVPKSKYARSRETTEAMRKDVSIELRPLFDHILVLADDSHKHGYFKRAGRELRAARKLAEVR